MHCTRHSNSQRIISNKNTRTLMPASAENALPNYWLVIITMTKTIILMIMDVYVVCKALFRFAFWSCCRRVIAPFSLMNGNNFLVPFRFWGEVGGFTMFKMWTLAEPYFRQAKVDTSYVTAVNNHNGFETNFHSQIGLLFIYESSLHPKQKLFIRKQSSNEQKLKRDIIQSSPQLINSIELCVMWRT